MKAVFIVESQPPSVAEILALYTIIPKFEKIIVCVQNTPMVISINRVLKIWELIILPYQDKVMLSLGDKDFVSVSSLPEQFNDFAILTISEEIFTHLQSLNLEPGLVPRVSGYEPIFHRAAYRQSKALDWLRTNQVEQ
jgi:hypothetical protein